MEHGAGTAVADDNVAAGARDEVEHTHARTHAQNKGKVCIVYVAIMDTSLLGASSCLIVVSTRFITHLNTVCDDVTAEVSPKPLLVPIVLSNIVTLFAAVAYDRSVFHPERELLETFFILNAF
jgi:hypothetical protein